METIWFEGEDEFVMFAARRMKESVAPMVRQPMPFFTVLPKIERSERQMSQQ